MHYIFAHLIGDFILQTDLMANGKKESSLICLVHVITYLLPFLFVENLSFIALLLIGVEHFIQDRTNIIKTFMIFKGSDKFAEPPMAPWSIIITDNIIHILFIEFIIHII